MHEPNIRHASSLNDSLVELEENNGGDTRIYTKLIMNKIREKIVEKGLKDWSSNINYSRKVVKYEKTITLPAFQDMRMDSWRILWLHAAAEERIFQFGAITGTARKCARSQVDETTYHVVSACMSLEYNARHDFVVYWLQRI